MVYRKLGSSLCVCCLLAYISMPAYSQEDALDVGMWSEAARTKLPAGFFRRNEKGLPPGGFIVEFSSAKVRADADKDRLALGLWHEDKLIRDHKAHGFSAVRKRVLSAMKEDRVVSLRSYRHLPMAHVRVANMAALGELLEDSDVIGVYPNEKHTTSLGESLLIIGQPDAGLEGLGVTVAVLDTGVDFTLPAFGSCIAPGVPASCKVVYAEDFAPDDGSLDASGHGTFVAGIVSGVAPGAKIVALDVFDGSTAWASDIIAAIDWAIANKSNYNIAAINMSLGDGLPNFNECPFSWAAAAFSNARAAGILPIVSSGNEGFPNAISSPACAPGAISVGAVYDDYLGSVDWSSCADASTAPDGVTCFSNSAHFLSLFAPGALIDAAGYSGGGTSASAPHVSGGVAVLRDAFPDDTAQQILDRMIKTGALVTDANNQGELPEITKPRLDLAAAVAVVGEMSITEAGRTSDAVDEAWYTVDLHEEFPDNPIIVSSIETYDGSDTAGLRIRNLGPSSFQVLIEEEQSGDVEIGHTTERVGYFAVEAGAITDSAGSLIGEAGGIVREQVDRSQWHTVNLAGIYQNPVVMMNIVTYAGQQPAHLRLRNVGMSSFQFQVEEWLYLDGYHVDEQIHYVVLESGIHELSGHRSLEVGKVQADHNFTDVWFAADFNDPVILSHSQTYNGWHAITTRQTDGGPSGFSIKVEEEEGNDGSHVFEEIGYIAIE